MKNRPPANTITMDNFHWYDIFFVLAGGAIGWAATLIRRNGNGNGNGKKKDDPESYAVRMIQFDNDRLRHENVLLEQENERLRNRVTELEKRVYELEVKIKVIEKKL